MLKWTFTFFWILLLLAACVPATPTTVPTVPVPPTPKATPEAIEPELPWWREAVFYEIFVRSFYDTDGNGIGDFNGITQKLDYLQDLGITAIWLMPIHPSPSYHGYDVINYYAVNADYGTLADFRTLLEQAHSRGIRIIVDLVINHTSSQHPWFVEASSQRESEYRDHYLWSESGGDGWHESQTGYYFGLFGGHMPDLNFNNPDVTADIFEITDYWLNDIGVDGFRVDAAKHLIEEGDTRENTPPTHEWYKQFFIAYKEQSVDAYAVGEVFGAGASVVKTYTGDQLDQIFNFEMANGFVNSVNGGASSGVASAIQFALQDMPDFNYATFLTNHDQDRVMSVFNGNVGKAKAAATLLLTSPGTPFVYYGEEIGMQGKKPDENIRLPMQWSSEANAGFTSGTPWRALAADYPEVNVADQEQDPDSLLNHYRELIALRTEQPALSHGDLTLLETGNTGLYAALRFTANQKLLVLLNLKNAPISEYQLTLKENLLPDGSITPASVFGTIEAVELTVQGGKFSGYQPIPELSPYQSVILQLE